MPLAFGPGPPNTLQPMPRPCALQVPMGAFLKTVQAPKAGAPMEHRLPGSSTEHFFWPTLAAEQKPRIGELKLNTEHWKPTPTVLQ